MIKMKKSLVFLSLFIILFISIGAISATDKNINNVYSTQNMKFNHENPYSLSELEKEIKAASPGATITLTKDYKVDNNRNINIDKPLIINGQGHTIEGSDIITNIFSIRSDNVTLKNITFINITSYSEGGAIYCISNNCSILNCSFVNCSANSGGAISWVRGDNGLVSGCTFTNCSANKGGAIEWFCGNDGVVNYNIFDNNYADNGSAIYTLGSINCDFNFFAYLRNVSLFPEDLVKGSTVNKWVILNISKDNVNSSVDFVCNDGSNLTNYMPDYAAKLYINWIDNGDITIKHNTFKCVGKSGDYLLISLNYFSYLARNTLKWDTTDYNVSTSDCIYGENATVTVKVNPSATGSITVKVDDNPNPIYLGIINKGVVTIHLSNLDVGTHKLDISYSGDSNYLPFNTTANLTVHGL